MWCCLQIACVVLLALSVGQLTEGAKLFSPGQQQLQSGVVLEEFVDDGSQARQGFTQPGFGQGGGGQQTDNAPAQYEFAYDVKVPEEGNDYGHAERRNGDTTEGMYRVLLPDGRVQVVTYSVIGDSGFVATVSYQ